MGEYLGFSIAGGRYALAVTAVREIVEFGKVTTLPGADPAMRGIINLRGLGVPVIDLRLRLGLPAGEVTKNTCIVILERGEGDDAGLLGAVTDSVDEVFSLPPEELEPPPEVGLGRIDECVLGIGRKNDGFIVVLDAERLFASAESGAPSPGVGVAHCGDTEA